MLTRRPLALLCLPLLLGLAAPLHAWGPQGHRLIGLVADSMLDESARRAVSVLLEGDSLARAGTWADEMRGAADDPVFWSSEYTGSWHYINVPAGESYDSAAAHPRGDAYIAIRACMAMLEGRPVAPGHVRDGLERYLGPDLHSAAARAFALRFYIHLIEDLHQPVHVGYPEDRGGNGIALHWRGEETNLHALWDTDLIMVGAPDESRHAGQLLAIPIAADAAGQVDPLVWINEDLALRDAIYDASPDGSRLDTARYHARFYPLASRRLALAGHRLAAYLNSLYD